jgi:hypothetical protein
MQKTPSIDSTACCRRTAWLLSLSLGGSTTSTAGSFLMDARAEAPAPPKTSVYLPVQDLPPKRAVLAMTADERSKLAKELIAAHDRQAPAEGGHRPPFSR